MLLLYLCLLASLLFGAGSYALFFAPESWFEPEEPPINKAQDLNPEDYFNDL